MEFSVSILEVGISAPNRRSDSVVRLGFPFLSPWMCIRWIGSKHYAFTLPNETALDVQSCSFNRGFAVVIMRPSIRIKYTIRPRYRYVVVLDSGPTLVASVVDLLGVSRHVWCLQPLCA